jgi:hypothetical protein
LEEVPQLLPAAVVETVVGPEAQVVLVVHQMSAPH